MDALFARGVRHRRRRFINNQSAIDFEALREFLEQQRVNVERLQNLELGPASLIDIET